MRSGIVKYKYLIALFLIGFYLVTICYRINPSIFYKNAIKRDYSSLIKTLNNLKSDKERARHIFKTAKYYIQYKYRPYKLIENPISYTLDKFHFGLAQVTDSRFLYEYSTNAFCGQKAKLMADLASEVNMPYRYLIFKNHVTIELFYDNGWRYYDPSGLLYFKRNKTNTERKTFIQLLLNHNISKGSNVEDINNVHCMLPNTNFFYKLELFNQICLWIWFLSVPILILIKILVRFRFDHGSMTIAFYHFAKRRVVNTKKAALLKSQRPL